MTRRGRLTINAICQTLSVTTSSGQKENNTLNWLLYTYTYIYKKTNRYVSSVAADYYAHVGLSIYVRPCITEYFFVTKFPSKIISFDVAQRD